MILTQFQAKVCILKIDNGKEYFSKVLGIYLEENEITHQSSCVDTPKQNGIAGRKSRHLLEGESLNISNGGAKTILG